MLPEKVEEFKSIWRTIDYVHVCYSGKRAHKIYYCICCLTIPLYFSRSVTNWSVSVMSWAVSGWFYTTLIEILKSVWVFRVQRVNKHLSLRHVLYCEPSFLVWHSMSNSVARVCIHWYKTATNMTSTYRFLFPPLWKILSVERKSNDKVFPGVYERARDDGLQFL